MMKSSRLGLAGLLAALLSSTAAASPVTLEEAISRALLNDPSIERAEAGLTRATAAGDMARAGLGPQAGIRAEIGALETDFTADSITQIPRSVGLQAEWNVFSSGANAAAVDAADFQYDAARSQLTGQREKTILQTFEAFAQAWLAEQVLNVAEARVETFDMRLQETQARFDQGQVTRTDVAMTEARLASSQAQLEATRAQLAAATARLARLTGVAEANPVGEFSLSETGFTTLDEALNRVLIQNSDLEAARSMQSVAGSRLEEARARFGPSISVRARATHGEDMFFFFEDPISDVGAFVTVEMPLFTNGMRQASERRALAARSQATADVRNAELMLREAVSGLWGDIQARRLAVSAASRAEAAARLAAEGALREHEAGLRTLVDALDAENTFRDAQIARIQAETSLKIAEARLLSLSNDLETAVSN